MKKCFVCGNHYHNCLSIKQGDLNYDFDCFECAIYQLAPTCQHCSCRIIGHGIEIDDDHHYCCAHCAREDGFKQIHDHLKEDKE